MGYTTDFYGDLAIRPAIKPEHKEYINKLRTTRRMKRDAAKVEALPDPVRVAAGLPVGADGEYFVGADGFMGQTDDASVLDHNNPPSTQPGLWCQWEVNDDGFLVWDGGEKFYHYVEWLEYLIKNFFRPWGYTLDGMIEWQGEDRSDMGRILVEDNEVTVQEGRIVYGHPDDE